MQKESAVEELLEALEAFILEKIEDFSGSIYDPDHDLNLRRLEEEQEAALKEYHAGKSSRSIRRKYGYLRPEFDSLMSEYESITDRDLFHCSRSSRFILHCQNR